MYMFVCLSVCLVSVSFLNTLVSLHRRGSLSCAERPIREKSLSYGSKIVRSEGVELKAVRPAAEKEKDKGKPSITTADTGVCVCVPACIRVCVRVCVHTYVRA